MKIGNIHLDMPIFQSPLSGYSDRAMRAVSRDCGAKLTFAGLMLDKSAAHPKVVSRITYLPADNEHPVGAQILGTEPEVMAKAAKTLEEKGYDIIDLNFACPARKVLARQRGGYLLNNPQRVRDIFRRVRDAVKCPVMMKLRIGYERSPESQELFWQICEQAVADSVDAITIHGRSVGQKYRGNSDWQIIAEAKRKFPDTIIIGSGDLFKAEDCVEKLKTSGADGLSIARGAIGNPWIFRDIRALLQGKELPPPPTIAEQGVIIKKHLDMVMELYSERKTVGYFRKFAAQYCRIHPERKKATCEIIATQSKNELYASIKKWYPY